MKALVKEGLTLNEIGNRYGLSRERVRQIVGNVGNDSLAARRSVNKKREEAQARVAKAKDEIVRLYSEEGWLLRDISNNFGIPDWRVSQVLREELGEAFRSYRERKPITKYTRDDVRDAIQRCAAEVGRSPTLHEYLVWSTGKGVPSAPTVATSIYGSWAEAKEDAGLEVYRRNSTTRRDFVDSEKCVRDVRQVWDLLGHPPTVAEYDTSSRRLKLTGAATIRKRLGSWNAAIRAADKLGPQRRLVLVPKEVND